MAKNEIFISFAAQEREIAVCLQGIIHDVFDNKIGVFVSDTTITAGERWDFEIEDNIKSAALMLVLCSPASIERQWVNFECGAIAYKGKPIVAICHSGITKSGIPPFLPLNDTLDLHNHNFLKNLFERDEFSKLLADKNPKTIQDKYRNTFEATVQKWFNKPPKEQDNKVRMVNLSFTDGVIGITHGEMFEERTEDLPEEDWQAQINAMRAFLTANVSNRSCCAGVAIGIQNCLLDEHGLSVGVRVKSPTDSYTSGSVIGMGMFNTGYALLRLHNIHNIASSDTLQDTFVTKPQFLKHFVKYDDNDVVYQKMKAVVATKGEKLWKLRLEDGPEVVATIFINNSRRYPRFEIGVWKYVDIRHKSYSDSKVCEQLSLGIVNGFGEDVFLDYRGEDDPQITSWIWVRDGVIRYWSYPEERMIPRNRPVAHTDPKKRPKHAVLVNAACMNNTYGNPVCYTPFASDEKLGELRENPEKLIKELFSSPARALLSCF